MTTNARPVRTHVAFSQIEQDVARYYTEPDADARLTALQVAGRALSAALPLCEEAEAARTVYPAQQLVFAAITHRLYELHRDWHDELCHIFDGQPCNCSAATDH